MKVIAVMPAYNESKTIDKVVRKAAKSADVLVVVDDGSFDGTGDSVLGLGIKSVHLYRHSINRGVGAATSTGIKAALGLGADIVVMLDSDGQHRPEDIPIITEPIRKGEADVVIGSRFLRKAKIPMVKRIGNKSLNLITKILYGLRCTDTQSGYKAFSRHAASAIDIKVDRYGVCSEIIGEIKKKKLRVMEVPIDAINIEKKGTTVMDGIEIAIDLVLRRFA